MLSTFLSHQRKSFWRSRNRGSSIAGQIVLGFFMLYFFAVAVGIGFGMSIFLPKIFPDQNILTSFNGIILYYFAFDFIMRMQFQELPTLSIIPYLHLKIQKSKIIKFLNVKALFSAFNIWPFFIFLPFCFIKISVEYGALVTIMYIVSIFSIMIFNNYLVLYIKRKSITNTLYTFLGLVVIAAFAALEYYKVISIMAGSDMVFRAIAAQPLYGFAFTIAAAGIFYFNSNFLRKNLYVEELSTKQEKKGSTDYAFLNRFGKVGELAALELKLILRHKRPRSSVILGFFFLFYGFIFYKEKAIDRDAFGQMMFGAIFMTGVSIIIYGQFMFAWQSAHFDGILANKINFKDYIRAKFLLFTIGCTIITLLASFYGFLSPKLLLLHLAAYLYNIGFGTVVVLYLATLNYKRLDITKAASFNYQGTGATQWLLMFPYALTPILIYLPFGILNKPYWGLVAVSVFGLAMLLLRGFWVNYIAKRLELQRYKIAEGFRE
ncbi:hypothetical protein SRABI27_01677 [Pedobacter sp. Bi27]|uniref:DUF5687 family protein n=1 Tax=unclassified Pedobacter TaxID=2628915 RepID=UPI001DD75FC1|nr:MULTISPECIES: DUF5687 family protein [unclassified Pedobacter]CAH0174176.1 hypothetical protein SRABI36_01339 [Pedobacter sp. Bi36]CAH0198358.1 hypothetical protein SRABI27_01677 [Pedobacter sp. Bi27]CAH0230052.1 hypothetical protein SRABI126_02432 [Pedobacter sp. Bi126]